MTAQLYAIIDRTRLTDTIGSRLRLFRSRFASPEGQARRAEGLLQVVGAVFELTTGRVRFLE